MLSKFIYSSQEKSFPCFNFWMKWKWPWFNVMKIKSPQLFVKEAELELLCEMSISNVKCMHVAWTKFYFKAKILRLICNCTSFSELIPV